MGEQLDLFTAPTEQQTDVAPGDVLVYAKHPGCAVRVERVQGYGRGVRAERITMCDACREINPFADMAAVGPVSPGTPAKWDVPLYALRVPTTAEAAAIDAVLAAAAAA